MVLARLSICTVCMLLVDSALAQELLATNDSLPPAVTAANTGAAQDAENVQLQFRFAEAPWPTVLEWIADKANLSLDMADEPTGTFNYIDDKQCTVTEAIDVMNGYLLPRGFVLLRRDQFLVVMKTDNPMLPNLIPTVPASQLKRYGNNELLRIVVHVEGYTPEEVANQVTTILGPKGVASPLDSSGALVLQGFGRSLREAVDLLDQTQAPPSDNELIFKSFTLRNIPASDAERQIQNLFGLGGNPYQAAMQRRAEWSRRERGREGEEGQQRPDSPTPLVENIAMNMKVSSLRQTNSLLVTATPAAITLIEDILATIDVEPAGSKGGGPGSNIPELRVYTVDNADEDDVAETVNAVIPGVVINEDRRNNSIHVLATPAEHDQVDELISTINSGGIGSGVEVIPLTQNDPTFMSEYLSSLFKNENRDNRPVITPGFQNQSLIVRGSSRQLGEIRKALASFNETGVDDSQLGDGNRVRRLPLGASRDAERIARTVKDLLEDNRQFDNKIRVVVPSDSSDSPAATPANNGVRRVPIEDQEDQENQASRAPAANLMLAAYEQPAPAAEEATSEQTEVPQATSEQTPQKVEAVEQATADANQVAAKPGTPARLPRVTIEVQGSDLLMYSDDAVALDKVEQTVRDLVRQMPSRTEWTVFFLRAAPADTTARTLVDLLRSDSTTEVVIGSAVDVSYSSLADETMRIVPDVRTNALFISGTDEQLKRTEQFLEFLDTSELPGSLRDRIPRSIAVEYADVNEVAQIIRELYKDYLVDPMAAAARGSRDSREAQARMARVMNQSQNSGLRPSGIQLTISVDEASNTLLISCNDTLFTQISQLVKQRDQAAYESQPVTQMMRISPSSAEQVRSVLSGMESETVEIQISNEQDRRRSRYSRDRRR
ncbi:secretin N-terminal domain-containing protein [Aeoliella mucimassa]|nr:secretin N-terminal domain-containing protein [Aeoliella mucimassa]